jgi:hypothetical protein
VILKSELGQLRAPGSDVFIIFAPEPDMTRFKALVVEQLERAAEGKKQRYDAALSVLQFTRSLAGEESEHPIRKDNGYGHSTGIYRSHFYWRLLCLG